MRSKGECEELMETGQQQEATVSKADPGFIGRESDVRAIMKWGTPVESAVSRKKDQPGFPRLKLPGSSMPLWLHNWGCDLQREASR